MTDFTPYALDIVAPSDQAFDIADRLGMEGEMNALSVTIFEAPDNMMLVQGLYGSNEDAETARAALILSASIKASITQLPDTDWVSETQSGLHPVKAGRFFIHGSHDADKRPADKINILIDAGLAFGTGHHGTTAGCLRIFTEQLDRNIIPNRILDLGCGAGILAIAAAKSCPNTEILATDIDPDSIFVTQENADLNDVKGRIAAHVVDGFDSPIFADRTFDLIFANILAGPLMGLADDIVDAMDIGGYVILSGILDEKAQAVSDRFTHAGLDISPAPSLNGWTSLLGHKPK